MFTISIATFAALTTFVFCDIASSSEVPWVVNIKSKVITILHVAHLFQWSIIIFQHNPKLLMDMSKSGMSLKNSTALEIRTLDLHMPFPLLHYSGISTLPKCCWIFQNQFLHSWWVHVCPWCAWPTSEIIIMDVHRNFWISLHHFLKRCTSHMLLPYTSSIMWWWISIGRKCPVHKNQITLPTSSGDELFNIPATAQHLVLTVTCYLYCKATPYQKIECFLNTKITG